MMSYPRDPSLLRSDDQFAYSGRAYGFVPWSIWYKEETANRHIKTEVSWFDHRGSRGGELVAVKTEPFVPEITLADVYDVRRGAGRFASVVCPEGHEADLLVAMGYKRAPSDRVVVRLPSFGWPFREVELTPEESQWLQTHNEAMENWREAVSRLRGEAANIELGCQKCANLPETLVIVRRLANFRTFENVYHHDLGGTLYLCEADSLHSKRGTWCRRFGVRTFAEESASG